MSYRHGQNELTQEIVRQLREALENEVRQWVDLPIYVDDDRLKPGYLYNEALARELCNSVCLIVVYTPTYFSEAHVYCTREFRGMEILEAKRFESVTLAPEERHRGLIIPVVFRGANRLPEAISGTRYYENFDSFMLGEPELSRHRTFKNKIRNIAEYIAERHDALTVGGVDHCSECAGFRLPSDDDVRDWLKTAARKPPEFPGREVVE